MADFTNPYGLPGAPPLIGGTLQNVASQTYAPDDGTSDDETYATPATPPDINSLLEQSTTLLQQMRQAAQGAPAQTPEDKDAAMLAFGQALLQPTMTRGFGGTLANINTALLGQAQAQQAAQQERAKNLSEVFSTLYAQQSKSYQDWIRQAALNARAKMAATAKANEFVVQVVPDGQGGYNLVYAPKTPPSPSGAAQPTPVTSGETPPVTVLKEGMDTKFANGQVWTLSNGKAKRVA